MELKELLEIVIKANASDLHLLVDVPPVIRIDGTLRHLTNYQALTYTDIESMVYSVLTPEQKELLNTNKELDFSFGFGGGAYGLLGRFRINAYFQRGYLSAAFRFLPPMIKSLKDLNLPNSLEAFTKMRQGFVLVVGPTGQGKSTTLASLINMINMQRACHILTIEDPIEYVYPKGASLISQREIAVDTHSWAMALRASLREDPDVVLIGEMRDPETMQAAMTVAETGHLVFATLHTNSASQTIDRIVDSFSEFQRTQVRTQLAATLQGIVSQRLVPRINSGRVPAIEILFNTDAVASNIREGKAHLIDSVIQTSRDKGMVTMEDSLAKLVLSGIVTLDVARGFALRQDELVRMVG